MFSANVPYPSWSEVPRRLWLYYSNASSLVVDGLGTAAAVEEADVGVTNGVVHVIDRVLGMPAQTVYEKLEKDPMMSSAFSLGNQDHFNDQLSRTDRKFTYLVPSNAAWEELSKKYSTAHKQLFMGYFGYQVSLLNNDNKQALTECEAFLTARSNSTQVLVKL